MGALANSLRIEQSLQALTRLQQELKDWLKKRRDHDPAQQHATQLDALDKALNQSLAGVRQQLTAIAANLPSREVYEACRLQEIRIAFVRYAWNFYATKFDQRDESGPYAGTLKVADEIVWSCYAGAFAAKPKLKRGSAPLPYIEAKFAPEALVRDSLPPDFTFGKQDILLGKFLQKLPIPIVALPLSCVDAPWELVLLGHEVAHHLEFDLAPDKGLVNEFQQWLWNNAPGWAGWDLETYADLAALCAMGPFAVRAIVELELAGDRTMLEPKPAPARYPRSAARIELMRRAATALGLDPKEAVGDFDPDALLQDAASDDVEMINYRAAAKSDYQLAQDIASKVFDHPFTNGGSLKQRFGWVKPSGKPDEAADYFVTNGAVHGWAKELASPNEPTPEQSLRAPRLIASASYRTWVDLVKAGQNTEKIDRLKTRTMKVISESREPGMRSGENVSENDLVNLGKELTQLMLDTLQRVD